MAIGQYSRVEVCRVVVEDEEAHILLTSGASFPRDPMPWLIVRWNVSVSVECDEISGVERMCRGVSRRSQADSGR